MISVIFIPLTTNRYVHGNSLACPIRPGRTCILCATACWADLTMRFCAQSVCAATSLLPFLSAGAPEKLPRLLTRWSVVALSARHWHWSTCSVPLARGPPRSPACVCAARPQTASSRFCGRMQSCQVLLWTLTDNLTKYYTHSSHVNNRHDSKVVLFGVRWHFEDVIYGPSRRLLLPCDSGSLLR